MDKLLTKKKKKVLCQTKKPFHTGVGCFFLFVGWKEKFCYFYG